MEWNEKLQNILDYIEEHLQQKEEPVSQEEISKIAGCSFDFFQKVFSYMNGISLSEYIRQRKLTLSGYDLKSTKMKVVEISYKYGYNSPTSFTKAFLQFHGVTPKQARNEGVKLCVTPKIQILYKPQYNWMIEQKAGFRLIGKRRKFSCVEETHYTTIPAFWADCHKDGTYAKLVSLDTGNPKGVFGFFGSYDTGTDNIEYSIMVRSDAALPDGFIEAIVPASTWAIFDCHGRVPEAIHKGWRFLNDEWLIKYPFQHAPVMELEWFSNENEYSDDYLSQIWIPIIKEES